MKRLCDFYYELWMSLRKEALPVKDQSPIAIQRDGDRLLEIAAKRGLRVFTLDLPALGSWYDLGLSTGRLVRTPLPLTRRVGRKTQIPRFMGEIVSRVFDSNGLLRDDADVTAVRALRQLCLLGKKARIDCDENKYFERSKNFTAPMERAPFLQDIGGNMKHYQMTLTLLVFASGCLFLVLVTIWLYLILTMAPAHSRLDRFYTNSSIESRPNSGLSRPQSGVRSMDPEQFPIQEDL